MDYSFTFEVGTNGTYEFVCEPHESVGMIGQIVVEPAPPTNITNETNETMEDSPAENTHLSVGCSRSHVDGRRIALRCSSLSRQRMKPAEHVFFGFVLNAGEQIVEFGCHGPGFPSPYTVFTPSCVMEPMGEITAAVPQQNASSA